MGSQSGTLVPSVSGWAVSALNLDSRETHEPIMGGTPMPRFSPVGMVRVSFAGMSRIVEVFAGLKQKGEGALVLFVTAGDPSIEELPAILSALAEGGADVIEVGVPFSDPIADGPTIQASSQRALDRGVTFRGVLDAVRGFDRAPIVLMGYANTFFRNGAQDCTDSMRTAGVSGTIVSDLIPDEAGDWIKASRDSGLDTVFLVAPTSTDERIKQACDSATGFVYCVSRTGVTGTGMNMPPDLQDLVSRVRDSTSLPVCVGFGISSPEHVANVCSIADGAVVGSWLVKWLDKNWNDGAGREALIAAVRDLKSATRR